MVVYTGKTIKEAVEKASADLGVAKAQLKVTVIQRPRHGFLGIGRRDAKVTVSVPVKPASSPKQPKPKQSSNVKAQLHRQNHQSTKTGSSAQPKVHSKRGTEVDPAVIRARHAANLKRVRTAGNQLVDYLQNVFKALGIKTTPTIKQVAAHEITIDIKTAASGRVIGHHGRRINALEQLANVFMNYHGAPKTIVLLDTSNYRARRQKALHELAERSVTEVVASGQAVFLDPMPAWERKQLHRELEDNKHVRTYSHGREPYRSVVIAPRN